MTALPKKKIYTPEEYLALEDDCEYRSEYDDGLIIAMAGGTREHIRISSNIENLWINSFSELVKLFNPK